MAKRKRRSLSGLGALGRAASGKKAGGKVSKGIKKTIASFVKGKSHGACKPGTRVSDRSESTCAAFTDGKTLHVHGQKVAFRPGGANSPNLTACPTRFKKTPEGRAGAGALLSALRTGLSYAELEGSDYLVGRNKGNGVRVDSECFEFYVPKSARVQAAKAAESPNPATASKATNPDLVRQRSAEADELDTFYKDQRTERAATAARQAASDEGWEDLMSRGNPFAGIRRKRKSRKGRRKGRR